jgi:hypothetical protein
MVLRERCCPHPRLPHSFSLKLFASTGVSARTNNNYDLFGIVVQYRWGAGLTQALCEYRRLSPH